MNIKAIISDLDGTLLPKGGNVSADTLDRFRQLGRQGIVRIIATGRTLYSCRQALPEDFPADYLIVSSGIGVFDWKRKEYLFTRQFSHQESCRIAGYLWNYGINFTVQREIPDNHFFYHTDIYPLHEDYKRRLAHYQPYGQVIYSPEEISGEATQFIMILDARQLHLLEKIRTERKDCSIVRSTSPIDNQAVWLEIFPKGINKGTSSQWLAERLHLRMDECAGIGNDYNDVDFLKLCGQSYVVGNAPNTLKQQYKYVACDKDNGFSEFVSRLF